MSTKCVQKRFGALGTLLKFGSSSVGNNELLLKLKVSFNVKSRQVNASWNLRRFMDAINRDCFVFKVCF